MNEAESVTPPVTDHLELKARLLMVFMLLLVCGAALFVLYARGAFDATQRLVLMADDSEGVVIGMDRTFSGFPIGRVRGIELADTGKVRILVDVTQKDAHWLRTSSVFTLVRGVVGAPNIRAYTGLLEDPPLPDGAVRTVLQGDVSAEIPKVISATRELIENLNTLVGSGGAVGGTLAPGAAAPAVSFSTVVATVVGQVTLSNRACTGETLLTLLGLTSAQGPQPPGNGTAGNDCATAGTNLIATDVIGGSLAMGINALSGLAPLVESNKLHVFAFTSAKRLPGKWSHVPTVAETLPGFELSSWVGLWVPAGTPKPIIDFLYAKTTEVIREPDFMAKTEETGGATVFMTPADTDAYVKAEGPRWQKLLRDAGIEAQ